MGVGTRVGFARVGCRCEGPFGLGCDSVGEAETGAGFPRACAWGLALLRSLDAITLQWQCK